MTGTQGLRRTFLTVVVLAVAAVPVLAVAVDGTTAAFWLAGVLAVTGVLRGVLPENVVPGARDRTTDVVVLLLAAAALFYLAPWGNATLPAGA